MSSLVDTLEHAGLVLSGAVLCYVVLQWKKREARRAQASESEVLLEKARQQAETVLRDARLTASEENLKQRSEVEDMLAARRAERLELERRLADREGLIN